MILDNAFTCPNGHEFRANAKIRARCPECGSKAIRNFASKPEPKVEPKPVVELKEPKEPTAGPVLLKAGKERMPAAKKPTTKAVVKKPATKSPTATKRTPAVKKPVTKTSVTGKTSGGTVTTKRVVGKIAPKVTGKPKRTAVARTMLGQRSYSDEMISKYGR